MQRLRFVTLTAVGILTVSLTSAAYSQQKSLSETGVIAPPQKTLNKKSSELAKKGAISPPQKALNTKSDEAAKKGIIIVGGKNKASEKMLNPQPLPPGPPDAKNKSGQRMEPIEDEHGPGPGGKAVSKETISTRTGKGAAVSLNPQPLPPKEKALSAKSNTGSDRMLNPQPLPPKAMNTLGSSGMMNSQSQQKALGGQKGY